ncbi:hypothetical protein BDV93DRAFT_364365 [Ceratobasidium sp. AG-I]|nr:hypothetical protein BDV93DRAFT_364365 [Ceratobasidium sp. AG-I]
MFLGAKIINSFLDGTLSKQSHHYNYWAQRLEQQIFESTRVLTREEGQVRFADTIELAIFKARVTDVFYPYQLLQKLAPVFLQLVYADLALWPNRRASPFVPLANILASGRHELNHFILMDMLCSSLYGLPHMVQYDTFTPVLVDLYPVHGMPAIFQLALIEIRSCYFQSYMAYDWPNIEHRLLNWQSPVCAITNEESWKTIAQLAVHESWRQTLLIYLYMAVCKVASDHVRVESSVRQVFQLINSATTPRLSSLTPHFFIQYIIAGACARNEKQRAWARDRLSDPIQSRMWLLRGSDFVPVLDHLWHGAAINGRPIRWDNYIASRQIALPTMV